MKRQFRSVTLAIAVFLAGSALAQAQAPATPAGAKIGIINIQRAIVESNEGRQAAEKLNSQFAPKRNELQAKQAEVEKLQKQLRDQEKTLSDEARSNLVRQIEAKSKEFTRTNEDATNDFQQAEAQVINEIGQKIIRVLDEYARKNGYLMVMDVSSPQSPVLWASTTADVTDDIIKIYNSANPGATGAAPAPGTAPAAKPAAPPAAKPAAPPAAKPAAPAAKKPGQR